MADKVLTSLSERLVDGRSALVVVDMQNDFCAEGGFISRLGRDVSGYPALAHRIQKLIQSARFSDIPVIWLMAAYDPASIPLPMRARQMTHPGPGICCATGSWGAAPFIVAPSVGEAVVVKHSYSGFYGTELDSLLRRMEIDSLVFAGVQTNVCVESTLRDAHSRGYYSIVASDCVLSHMPAEHEASLNTIGFLFGDVVGSGAVAELWRERLVRSPRPSTQNRELSS
jgi:ureidoacrylate peracid hydrolase